MNPSCHLYFVSTHSTKLVTLDFALRSSRLSISVINTQTRSRWEKKGHQATAFHGENSRQEPRPGRSAAVWLAPSGSLSLLPYTTKDHLPMGDTTHSGLGAPRQIISGESMKSIDLHTGNPREALSHKRAFLPSTPELKSN